MSSLLDFHVAYNNGYPPGWGTIDWRAYIQTLREIGYDGYLTGEFVVPIDRTPAALAEQELEVATSGSAAQGTENVLPGQKTEVLSERYYDLLVQQTGNFLRGLL